MYKSHLEFQIRPLKLHTRMTKLHGLFVSFVLCSATIKSGRSRVISSAVISPLSLPPLSQSIVS